MSKRNQVKAHWGNAKSITAQAKKELQSILHTDEKDPRYLSILEAYREASNYQRHIDYISQFVQPKKDLRKTLADIRKGILKAQQGIAVLSRESERRLDWFSSIRKGKQSSIYGEYLKYQETPYNEREKYEFDSGFSILLYEMEQTVEYYLNELKPGKPKKHQYSLAISCIAKVFEEQFPEYALPVKKKVGEETVFYKVIALWHDFVERGQKEYIGSVKRKIESAMENYHSDK